METSKVRIQKWDNLKFFLIFCVILGHIADVYAESSDPSIATERLRLFIYSFHMPLFMFISGLFEKKNIDYKRYDRIFSYLIMFILIKVLVFISDWICDGTRPKFSLISTGNVAWFAFCLFAFSFITMAVRNIKPSYVIIVSLIIACIAGYDNGIGDKLCLSRIIVFFPFYYLGYILKPADVMKFFDRKSIKIASVFVLAGLITATVLISRNFFFLKFVFTGRQSFHKIMGDDPFAFRYRIICYIISFLLGCCFIALCPNKCCNGFFAKLGSVTLQVYVLHMPLRNLYMKFVNDTFSLDSYFQGNLIILYEILVSIFILLICILPFWKKLFDKILKLPLKQEKAASTIC